jgi:hypothetical protein
VTFEVSLTDDESRVVAGFDCYSDKPCTARTDFGEWGPVGYGPWSPPIQPSTLTQQYAHTFAQAGTYTASFSVGSYAYGYQVDCPGDPAQSSGSDRYVCRDPYLEFTYAKTTITVSP